MVVRIDPQRLHKHRLTDTQTGRHPGQTQLINTWVNRLIDKDELIAS